MNTLTRIYLLLWKNSKNKVRHPLTTIVELGVPCLFSVILAIVRVLVVFESVDEPTVYNATGIQAKGLFDSESIILFSPNNTEISNVMDNFMRLTHSENLNVVGFESEDEMVDYYKLMDTDTIICGVVFHQLQPNIIDFKLRFPFVPQAIQSSFSFTKIGEFTWKTAQIFPLFQVPGPRAPNVQTGGPPDYYNEGFLFIQHQLSKAIAIHYNSNSEPVLKNMDVKIQRFPYPPYKNDKFLFSLQFMFPLILMLSFIYPTVNLTKNIVTEKELRLEEAMKMMGLQRWLHWTSWFINSFSWNLISITVNVALLCTPLKDGLGIISTSNPILVLLFFTLYWISSIMFCFLLSTLFNKANIAGIISGALYFALFLPYFQVNMYYQELTFLVKISLGLIFNTNMAIGCMLISMMESDHAGLQWSNLFEPASPQDTLTFFHILLMFVVDSVIYFLLAFYISNVFPGEYGLAKKWYFIVQPSYWLGKSSNSSITDEIPMKRMDVEANLQKKISEGITISNMFKSYNKKKSYAVNGLNLELAKDEITVLLGHNGAGKTTLMSILCGLIPPSSGTAHYGNMNLVDDIEFIRKDLGICPQFDILFDYLTVEEHLWFYCMLKGIDRKLIESEINNMVALLDLKPKRMKQARTLSGGMKRKLSVGIALAGRSKFVLLDEPTSGMDVSARRFIWDLLIKEKQNRVILLSTHFMEEADVLGNKIAVMEEGQLKCFDTPMNLKKKYGLGYLLTLIVKEEVANVKLLTDLIRSNVNNSKLLTSVGSEITFSLSDKESHKFPNLFRTIEANLEKLGVLNFGIAVTTMEEVFLRVGNFSKQGVEQFNDFSKSNEANGENNIIQKIKNNSLNVNTGIGHWLQIYWSMIVKKVLFTYRNLFLIVAQFVLPCLLLLISILTNRNQMDRSTNSPALEMTISNIRKSHVTLFHKNSTVLTKYFPLYENISSKVELYEVNGDVQKTVIESLVEYGEKDEAAYNLFYLISAIFRQTVNGTELTALFNNQAYHSSSVSVKYIDQTLLRSLLNNSGLELFVWNHPLPRKAKDAFNSIEFDSTLQVQLANNIQFCVCFLLASFAIMLVKESITNFKHIQQIGGLKLFQYWTSNFSLDFLLYMLSCLGMAVMILILQLKNFDTFEQYVLLIVSFAAHGLAALPFIYIFCLFFKEPATAYVRISLYLLMTGTVAFLVVLILEVPDFGLVDVSEKLDYVFVCTLPIYTIAKSVYNIYQNRFGLTMCLGNTTIGSMVVNIQKDICDIAPEVKSSEPMMACCKGKCIQCMPFEESYWAWESPGIGFPLVGFLIQAVIFWSILTLLESKIIKWSSISALWKAKPSINTKADTKQDDDVLSEEERICTKSSYDLSKSDTMIVKNVTKKYGKFVAVNNISFGVKKSECFGILGVNGAGKTTTFKMITGAEEITNGMIFINGNDVKKDMSKVYRDIGYCPQFDGLLDTLTGRETLKIVSRIRGIKEDLIDSQIDALSRLLFFEKHINQPVEGYSGGTKRKLSFAISIVGNPLIVFLDEPTTGVDPVSRRCLWNAVQLVRSAGSSMVLTSHSMEECEALCNRLIIMVNSKISCIGTPLHLKQKFSVGYIIQIKLKSVDIMEQEKENTLLDRYMTEEFANCRLESTHNSLLTYRVDTNEIPLSTLFERIEKMKNTLSIEDYSINQTSLERIFLSFARNSSQSNL